jgi:hypothetical protein
MFLLHSSYMRGTQFSHYHSVVSKGDYENDTPSLNISCFSQLSIVLVFVLLYSSSFIAYGSGDETDSTVAEGWMAVDGVGTVTWGRYVSCRCLCIKLLEKLDLTEPNNSSQVNYTGRAWGPLYERPECDVIHAGCRLRRRCLPFPARTLSHILSLSLSLSVAPMLEYTPEEKLGRTAWGEKEHPSPFPATHCGARKMKNQGYQRHW